MADNRIVIDTKMENRGIIKGVRDATRHLEKVTDGYKGANAQIQLQKDGIQRLNDQLSAARQEAVKIGEAYAKAKAALPTKRPKEDVEAYEKQRLEVERINQEYREANKNVSSLSGELRKSTLELNRMHGEASSYQFLQTKAAENLVKAQERLVQAQGRKIAAIREETELVQTSQNTWKAMTAAEKAHWEQSAEYAKLSEELKRAEIEQTSAAMSETTQRMEEQAKAASDVNSAVGETGKTVFELKREFAETTMQPLRDELEAARYQITEISAELNRLQSAGEAPKGVIGMQRTLEASRIELDKLEATLSRATTFAKIDFGIRPETAAMMDTVSAGLKDISGGLSEIGERAGITSAQMDTIPATMNKTTAAGKRQTSILRELAAVAVSVGAGIRKAFSDAVSIIRKSGKALSGIGSIFKGIHRDTNTASNGFTRMGKRIFGLAIAALVFNQIRRQLRSLVSYYGEAMKQNVQLNVSFALLKGSALSAFQPLYEAAIPIIMQFVSWLTVAIQQLGTFIALLFKVDPTKMQANAKAMWNNVKATKAGTKEQRRFLATFDELITMSDEAAGAGADMGEIVPDFDFTPPPIAPWMEKLKNIFKEADFAYWFGIGATAAGKFANALRKIPWDSIRKGARNLGENLAGLIGGFLSDEDMWVALGHTLAQGLNTALDFLYSFAKNFPWKKVGKAFSSGINEFVKTFDAKLFADTINSWAIGLLDLLISAVSGVDRNAVGDKISTILNGIKWKDIFGKLGTLISQLFKGALDTLYTIFSTVDFGGMGSAFARGLNKVFSDKELWTKIGKTLGSGANSAINFIHDFIRDFDWVGVGKSLATGINDFISEVNWKKVGKTFSDGIKAILDAAISFLDMVDWGAMGQAIVDLIAGIDWAGMFGKMWQTSIKVFFAIAELVKGLFIAIRDGISNYFKGKIDEVGGNIGLGILKGIGDVFLGIFKWLKDNIVTPFIDAFKKLFGIHSPSTVMAEFGKNIIQGLINGIGSLINGVIGKAGEILSGISNKLKEGISKVKEIGGNIGSAIGNGINIAKSAVVTIAKNLGGSIVDGVSIAINKAKEVGKNIINAIGLGMQNGVGSVVNTAQNAANAITNATKDSFGIKSPSRIFRDQIGAMLGEGVAIGFEQTSGLIKNAFTDTIEGAGDDVDGMESQGYSIGTSLLRGLELAYTPIVNFFRNLMADIQSVISTSLPTIPQITIPQLPRAGFIDRATISAMAERGGQQGAAQANERDNKQLLQDVYATVYGAFLDALDASGRVDDILTAIRAGGDVILDGQRVGRRVQNINNGRSAMLGGTV